MFHCGSETMSADSNIFEFTHPRNNCTTFPPFDAEYNANPLVICKREWLNRLAETRMELWGEEYESMLDFGMIVLLASQHKLESFLSKIE